MPVVKVVSVKKSRIMCYCLITHEHNTEVDNNYVARSGNMTVFDAAV